MSRTREFDCRRCGERHEGFPLVWATEAPELYLQVPEAERLRRCQLGEETCVIDDRFHFVLGCLEVPIQGHSEVFTWLVWVSLSPENMSRTLTLWSSEDRVREPPYFGWLSSSLPYYPETLNLKTRVHMQEVGCRPQIELEPTEHPLAVEQRCGIDDDRMVELASALLHGDE